MKRCPQCSSTYTDDSLRFCLQDGATLLAVSNAPSSFDADATLRGVPPEAGFDPPPTEILRPAAAPTIRTPAPTPTVPDRPFTRGAQDSAPSKTSSPLLIAGVSAIVILLLVLIGIGVALLFRDRSEDDRSVANANEKRTDTASTNASPESKRSGSLSEDNVNGDNKNADAATPTPETRGPLRVTATASSTRAPMRGFDYVPGNVLDQSLTTAWVEGVRGPGIGEWIRCDFDREVRLQRILITPGYFKTPQLWRQNNRLAAATFYFSDGSSRSFTFPDRMVEQRLEVGGVRTRWVRLVIDDIYAGSADIEDTPVSSLVFESER